MPFLLTPNTPANQKLWRAVVHRDEAAARRALAEGADSNVAWKGHTSALLQSVLQRDETMAGVLLDGGAWSWRPGVAERGRIPIEEAAKTGEATLVRRMLGCTTEDPLPVLTVERWWALFRASMWSAPELLDGLLDAAPDAIRRPERAETRAQRWAQIAHAPLARVPVFERLRTLPGMAFPERGECSDLLWARLVGAAMEGHAWVEQRARRSMRPADLFHQAPHKGIGGTGVHPPLLVQIMGKDAYFFAHDRARRVLEWLKTSGEGRGLLAKHRDALLVATALSGSVVRMRLVAEQLGVTATGVAGIREHGKPLLHHAAVSTREPGARVRLISWLVAHGADPREQDERGRTALEIQCTAFGPREPLVRALIAVGCPWTDNARSALRERLPALASVLAAEEMDQAAPTNTRERAPRRRF